MPQQRNAELIEMLKADFVSWEALSTGGLPVHALVGGYHSASGLTAGHVVRASGATTFAWAQLQHADLGGISPDQHHAQSHVLATNAGLGADHTMSGATAGHVLRASGATAAAFAQLQHSDLGGVSADQHHAGFVGLEDNAGTAVTPAADDRIQLLIGNNILSITAGTNVITFTANQGNIDHDSLSGFVANEHIDHSGVSILAGDGLTGGGDITASRTLNVGAGDGIDVAADSVAVDVTDIIGVGLSEDASNNLILGTPSTLTVSTTNSVSGTTHTHAVTSSSNPGAAASLLATGAAGLVQLVGLGIGAAGAADQIVMADGASIGQAAGPLLTFNDTNDYLGITGCMVGIGTNTPDRLVHPEASDAATNAITYAQRLSHITSGTPAIGFGTGIEFELEHPDDGNEVTGLIQSVWSGGLVPGGGFADLVLRSLYNVDGGMVYWEGLRIAIASSEVVVNDGSKRLSFRVESDTLTHALFVQGSDGAVGLGVSSLPSNTKLTVNGALAIVDGMTAPGETVGWAKVYVDSVDGDLKVVFGDGIIKTIATDT